MPKPSARPQQISHSYESHFEHAALFEFTKVINSSLDLNFILSHILLTIMGKILSTRGMAVLAHQKGYYHVEVVKGFPAELHGASLVIKSIPASLFHVNAVNPSRHPWIKFFRRAGVSILLPMMAPDRTIGLLGFGGSLSTKRLQSKEKTYLRSLGNISASAIHKVHMIQELQQVNRKLDRKIQELNTLFELGKEFSALLDPDKLIRLLVFSLLGQTGVNRYLVCLRDGNKQTIVASRVDGAPPPQDFLDALMEVKSPLHLQDIAVKRPRGLRDLLMARGLTVLVPLHLGGESKGVVLLGEKLSREPFTAGDFEFLMSLGNLATISIENARLFKEEIEKQRLEDELLIARDIQQGLLPSAFPDIRGADIAATNVPSKQVGGDYYDVIRAGRGTYIIAIGDVSGKGTPAALLMANLQAAIRALVPLDIPLNELTARVNDLMCQNTGGNKFVTFFWGRIDTEGRTLTYVNAGHNYPYLFRDDGTCERLDRGGMILGVMKTTLPYEQATVQIRPRDLLVLFTDGVSEAMSKEGVDYGEDRLEVCLQAHRGSTAAAVIEAVQEDVLTYTKGASQSDDLTMMVVRFH